VVPPKPPFFDVRTPEYTVFDDVQQIPWECVRGMDHSFGYNRESTEGDFLPRGELLWSLADIAAKGGNLLLNVGPRGEDATIADEQLQRLDWLGEFTAANGAALFGTRPWVHAQERTNGEVDVRYTVRGDEVFAFVRGPRSASRDLLLAHVRGDAATRITNASGLAVPHRATGEGVAMTLDAPLSPEIPASYRLQGVHPA
jgi:alpha-L-fucosidase